MELFNVAADVALGLYTLGDRLNAASPVNDFIAQYIPADEPISLEEAIQEVERMIEISSLVKVPYHLVKLYLTEADDEVKVTLLYQSEEYLKKSLSITLEEVVKAADCIKCHIMNTDYLDDLKVNMSSKLNELVGMLMSAHNA